MLERYWNKIKNFSIILTQSHKRTKGARYIFPIVLLSIVIFVKFFLDAIIGEKISYHLSILVVILSAWYGGLGPGLIATFLTGTINHYFFIPDRDSLFSIDNIVTILIFFVVGASISLISEAIRQADVHKDEFIGFASHELKNPLAAMKGYAAILQMQAKKWKDKKTIYITERLEAQVNKATNLISDLFDITKMQAGKLVYNEGQFQIDELVKNIVADQIVTTKTHKIHLKGRSDKTIYGDRQRIGQVLSNLITNAIKYSPQADKVEVKIKRERKEVVISIRDYGVGIEKSQQKKVFEQFFRGTTIDRSNIQGLGIGLFIASQIVKHHRGKLWLNSAIGKGSTFYLQLPVIDKK